MDKENIPKYYDENMKKAIYKYRENNREKFNERQRKYYAEKCKCDEWREKFNERCREGNKKYREKKREQNPPRPRGRPRKI